MALIASLLKGHVVVVIFKVIDVAVLLTEITTIYVMCVQLPKNVMQLATLLINIY